MKVGVLSLGCPRNLVDSEGILGRLVRQGHIVTDISRAEVGIVNTCAFVKDAKEESIDAILDLIELKRSGKLKKIIVHGCLAQRYKQELTKELPEIDAFVGRVSLNHEKNTYRITPGHFAYLKICESCINKCSFCVIPEIKGKFSSLDIASLVNKAVEFDETGVKELNIIGQDISGYGLDLYGEFRLIDLIKKLLKSTKNIRWLRLLYLYPSRVTDDLLKLIKSEERVCKYIDLPVQHINSRILKLMRRNMGKDDIRNIIANIRKKVPEAAIRTSVIVGFPTETDKEFKELLDFIRDVKFERLGAFIYSAEEGTGAYKLKNRVSAKTQKARFNEVMSVQQDISREVNAKFMGKDMRILIEEKDNGVYLGRSQFDAPEVDGIVYVKSQKMLKAGDIVQVKITDTMEYDLMGEAK